MAEEHSNVLSSYFVTSIFFIYLLYKTEEHLLLQVATAVQAATGREPQRVSRQVSQRGGHLLPGPRVLQQPARGRQAAGQYIVVHCEQWILGQGAMPLPIQIKVKKIIV